jgi:hypothetical protein
MFLISTSVFMLAYQNCANNNFNPAPVSAAPAAAASTATPDPGSSSAPLATPAISPPVATTTLPISNVLCATSTTAPAGTAPNGCDNIKNAFVGQVIVQPPSSYYTNSNSGLLYPTGIPSLNNWGGPVNGVADIRGTLFTGAATDVESYISHSDWATKYFITLPSLDSTQITGYILPTSIDQKVLNQNGVLVDPKTITEPSVHSDPNVTSLVNYFALSLQGAFQLAPGDVEDDYEFAVVSDDGAMLAVLDTGSNTWKTLVDNQYRDATPNPADPHIETITGYPVATQWDFVGCSNRLFDQTQVVSVHMTQGSSALLRVDWFNYWQGMTLWVYYRRVHSGVANANQYCGRMKSSGSANDNNFFPNSTDIDAQLKSLGWKPIDSAHLGTLTSFIPVNNSPIAYPK